MRSSSSLPLSMLEFYKNGKSALGHRHQNAARRIVEQRSPDRAFPPACGERGVLVVAEHDEVDAEALRQPADLLDRLAHREVAVGIEAAIAQRANALVEHRLGALLLLLEQLFGYEALGEEQARRHARHREQVGLRLEEARQVGAFEQRALAFLGAVVGEKDLSILHDALLYLRSSPTRSIVARSALYASTAQRA